MGMPVRWRLSSACNGHFLNPAAGPSINRGDVTGWAGDLMTFYGEWRRDSASYASGYSYCQQFLAKIGPNGSFKMTDLVEDADGYNIAKAVRAGTDIATAVHDNLLDGGYLTRFSRYFQDRFGGTALKAAALAKDTLLNSDDPVIIAGRFGLVQSTGGFYTEMPTVLPDGTLAEFCRGFGEILQARADQERTQSHTRSESIQ
jgi:hypothetical protein